MLTFLISAIKIIVILGFLVLIHETGHFLVARLFHVKVNEFSIGFGPKIWKKETPATCYSIRAVPLGGFVNMEGEAEPSAQEGSFSRLSVPKRFAIVTAGAIVNILFGLLLSLVIFWIASGDFSVAMATIGELITTTIEGLRDLVVSAPNAAEQLVGPVGISGIISSTQGILDFLYVMAVISISLGVTNLLPIPALDGGKLVLLLLEAIRKKPLKEKTELTIQAVGMIFLLGLAAYVTFNDVTKLF